MKNIIILCSTIRCNRNCSFCQHNMLKDNLIDIPDMTVDICDGILSKFSKDSTITITGGEPFLNFDLITHLCELKRQFCVHTNGDFLIPDNTIFPDKASIRISINSTTFPILWQQMIEDYPHLDIRVNTIFSTAEETYEIVRRVNEQNIYDYTVLIDFYTGWSEKLEQELDKFCTLIARDFFLPGKNKSYHAYHHQLFCLDPVVKFNSLGQQIPSIYAEGLQEKDWDKIKDLNIERDKEIFLYGKDLFKKGRDYFSTPSIYYNALMYELLKKKKEERRASFFKAIGR